MYFSNLQTSDAFFRPSRGVFAILGNLALCYARNSTSSGEIFTIAQPR